MYRKLIVLILATLLFGVLLAACGSQPATREPTAAPAESAADTAATTAPAVSGDRIMLSMWTHSAGNENELKAIQEMVDGFNATQEQYEVVIEAFPQVSYNDSVAAASVAGSLPCILDLDGPTVPNFAWGGYVQKLPVSDELVNELSPAAIGRYKGDAYSLGQFDVALLIYARKSILDKYGIRIPTLDEPWTMDEFMQALQTLKDSGEFEYPLDLNAAGTGEWVPYAYSPFLQSFGGDLINRNNYLESEGVLYGSEALAWAEWFQSLFENEYANPTPADDQGFYQGRVALWYTGSWSANDVIEQVGDDALFLPTVDLGTGPKIGGSSWQWGVSASCPDANGAWQFIK
jgi:multiple sugar transport system substrate-binding protein